jgi:hypothetical protein
MRDNYVGDIGDYVKYGLLRSLSVRTGARLGVVWYLYPDPCKETDGRHLDYLNPAKEHLYRHCDPELYDKLRSLIADNDRNVAAVRRRGLLPKDALFYETPLSLSGLPKGVGKAKLQREQLRQQWLAQALTYTEAADLVFLDPDNGLEIRSTAYHQDKGPKFAFYREVEHFWNRGQSLAIYQHATREGVEQQIRSRSAELQNNLNTKAVYAIYLPSYSGRIFFIVPQPKIARPLKTAAEDFVQCWPQVRLLTNSSVHN